MVDRWFAHVSGVALFVAVALFVGPETGRATTVLKLDLESLTANSDRIVVGEVESIDSLRHDGKIVTDIEVRVAEQWKGASEPPDAVTIRQPGGRIGDTVTRVHGMPRFREGETTVLFLDKHPEQDLYSVTGLRQGKFHVAIGPDGATEFVVPRLGNVQLMEPKGEGNGSEGTKDLDSIDASDLRISEPDSIHETVTPLESFRERVMSSVDNEQGEDR